MSKKIGFIGGGQMAEAIIKGLLRASTCPAAHIFVAEPAAQRRTYLETTYKIAACASFPEISTHVEIIILAVKPQVMAGVLEHLQPLLQDRLLITIAAGLPISYYADSLKKDTIRLIRVMPNMPALVLAGASALSPSEHVRPTELAYAETLFAAIGSTVIVEENMMDSVTGLSGSGPAYVFSFIEALIDGGVKAGLSRDIATELSVQTVLGAATLAKDSTTHPALLRDRVTSPGGTTASGLHVLENAGFKGIVISAVEAARQRSCELGNKIK